MHCLRDDTQVGARRDVVPCQMCVLLHSPGHDRHHRVLAQRLLRSWHVAAIGLVTGTGTVC